MLSFKTTFWWILWIAVVVVLYVAAGGYRIPLIIGFLLAYVLEPIGTFGKLYRVPRWVSALLILVFISLIFSLLFSWITPRLSTEIGQFILALPESLDQLAHWLARSASDLLQIITAVMPFDAPLWLTELQSELDAAGSTAGSAALIAWKQLLLSSFGLESIQDVKSLGDVARVATNFFQSYGSLFAFLGDLLRNSFVDIVNFTIALILIVVVYFFIFVGWRYMKIHLEAHIPSEASNAVWSVFEACGEVLSGYFRGMATMVLVMATYYSTAYALIGVPYALTLGLLTGSLILLPIVGFLLSFMILLSVTVFPFSSWFVLFGGIACLLAGQILENFVLTPRLVGQRIGLHPLLTIFAIIVFGQYWGLVGVLIAIPVTGVLYRVLSMLNAWLTR